MKQKLIRTLLEYKPYVISHINHLYKDVVFKESELTIEAITPKDGYMYGLELTSTVIGSYQKFRVYLNKGQVDSLQPFRSELKSPRSIGDLEDEIMTTHGTVFGFLLIDSSLAIDYNAILMENGDYIFIEGTEEPILLQA